jgi:hypothetical protein
MSGAVVMSELTKVYLTTEDHPNYGLTYDDGYGRRYQFVYLDDNVDVVAGGAVIAADDTVMDHAVTADLTGGSCVVYAGTNTNMHIHAGIALAAADVSANERGVWVQQTGRNVVAIVTDTYVAVGRGFVMNADGGTVGLDTVESDADPMTNIHRVAGFALDADTAASLAIGDAILTCECV